MRQEHDHYQTPGWMLDCLTNSVKIAGLVSDPCAGANQAIATYMAALGNEVITNDLNFPNCHYSCDMTLEESWKLLPEVDWVVMNPPYTQPDLKLFLKYALKYSKKGVAALLRVTADEMVLKDQERSHFWFENPYSTVIKMPRYCFALSSKTGKPSVDSAYCQWVVWDKTGETYYPAIYYPVDKIPNYKRSHNG